MAKEMKDKSHEIPVKRFGKQFIPQERFKNPKTEIRNEQRMPTFENQNINDFKSDPAKYDVMSNPPNNDLGCVFSEGSEWLNKSQNCDKDDYSNFGHKERADRNVRQSTQMIKK